MHVRVFAVLVHAATDYVPIRVPTITTVVNVAIDVVVDSHAVMERVGPLFPMSITAAAAITSVRSDRPAAQAVEMVFVPTLRLTRLAVVAISIV